jgi:hypothetical protein
MESSKRRLSVLSGHLAPGAEVELATISRAATSASTSGSGSGRGSNSTFASATGRPTSYARVHGEPSRAPAQWRQVRSVAKEELQDVLYSKAIGEGIDKVRTGGAPPAPYQGGGACRLRRRLAARSNRAGRTSPAHSPSAVQITINRPDKRNAFRPRTGEWIKMVGGVGVQLGRRAVCRRGTHRPRALGALSSAPPLPALAAVMEMSWCFGDARDDPTIGVIILTGEPISGIYGLYRLHGLHGEDT